MSTPSHLEAIFFAALEKGSPAERAAYLDEACAGDSDLRERVERMLTAQANAGSFLEVPAGEIDRTIDQPITERPGTMVGRYKLLEQIGEGGMGLVFMARQREPVKRNVALKLIKPGMDSKQVIARFEAERQALALMDHPNIARVLDAGSTESGRPYFVMDLVKGIPITEYCDRERLSTRERLELFIPVCQAVQHAHQKGIIHRDIKPTNVMITLHDGTPVPKVIDFGVAKATNRELTQETLVTSFAQVIGTPLYMSPEQAEMSGLDIDTRTDVYALGVLLYELLTGTTPFEQERFSEASYDEMRRIIREEEPPKPSTRISTLADALDTIAEKRHTDSRTLTQQVSGELDWIVMKALEKDRTRRYETASDFAKDVTRYLDDEPVEACPPSRAYLLRKFARRNKATMLTVASVTLALILGAGIAAGQAVRATKAERLAKRQEQLAIKQMQLAEEAAERERRLAEEAKAQRKEAVRQREQAEAMLVLALQDFNPVGAAFDPDGNFYVSSHGTSRVLRFDGSTGAFISEFVTAGSGALDHPEELVFGPDANGDGADDLYVANGGGNSVLQYDGATGAFLGIFVSVGSGRLRLPTGLTFGPDGNLYVMSFGTDSVLRYDATDGRFLDEFVPACSGGLNGPQIGVFGPDGNLYVASFGTDSVLRYDGTSGDFMDDFVPPGSGGLCRPEALAFGPEGTLYVISGRRTGVLRYDGKSGQFLDEFIPWGAGGMIGGQTLIFRPDGNLYVTSFGTDRVPRYDGETGKFIDMFATYDRVGLIGRINMNPALRRGLVEGYLQIAVAQQKMGNDKEAERTVGRVIELAAESPDGAARASFRIGDEYYHQRKYDEALPYLDHAIGFDPAYSEAYDHRGYIYFERGDLDKAIADFDKAIQFGAVYSSSYSYRGGAYAEKGNFTMAIADYSKVIERVSGTASYRHYHALAHLGAEDIDGYRTGCAQMLEQFGDSKDPQEAYWVAWTCLLGPEAVDDYRPVVRLAEQAVEADPDSYGYLKTSYGYLKTLGAILYRAGQFEDAVERLTEANNLIEDPDTESESSPAYAWYFLAMAHHKLEHDAEAKKWLQKATEWTDKVIHEDEEGTTTLAWNRRLTLKLLREETEGMIGPSDQPDDAKADQDE